MPPDVSHIVAFCVGLGLVLFLRVALCHGGRPAPLLPTAEPSFACVAPDGAECVICLDRMTTVGARLPCGHVYHRACIARWAAIKPTCPLCTASLS